MSLVMRNKDPQQAVELSNNTAEKSLQRFGYMLPSLLLAGVGLLIASAAVWIEHSAQQHSQQNQLMATWGVTYTAAINQRLSAIQAETSSAAAQSELVQIVQEQDPRGKRDAESNLLHRPDAVDAYLKLRGQSTPELKRDAPINFAALDLLQRAQRDPQPAPEALQFGQRWLLYSVAKLNGDKAPGSLLIAYDLASVLKDLPSFPDQQLQVRLQQQFANAPVQTLYSLGEPPSDAISQSFSTQHPNWSVVISAPAAITATADISLALLTALSVATLSILGAFYMLYISIQRQLKADVRTLNKITQDQAQGKSLQPYSLNLIDLQPLVKTLIKQIQALQQQSNRASRAKPMQADLLSSSVIDTPQQPLQADILDIDILDEDLDMFAADSAKLALVNVTAAQDVPSSIFRAYDIRGIVDKTLSIDTAYWIGRAVGSESLAKGEPSVVVGRDGRLSGPNMAQALIQGLLDCGCNVTDLGMVPTPVLYFATHMLEATSGVMVTGSHNPPNYNGFKIVITGETLANQRITALHTRIVNDDLSNGTGQLKTVEMLQRYLEHISHDIKLPKAMRVVVDCGNGVGGVIAPQLLEALGCTIIPLYCDVDGTFPNHHPDPGKPENLQDLIARVKSEKADIGIAFDGDADRIGVVTNSGRIIFSDHLMMLFAKDVLSRNPGADVIFDVKCTRRLAAVISENGGNPIMWKTGHSLMKAKMRETGALLAGEMSGHIFFKERWFGFDDGIYSAARLLEILSADSRDADQVFADFPVNLSTPEINIEVTEETKFKIIERLQREGQWGDACLIILDGLRADFPKSWGLVRASNTTPMLVLRFEGETADDLEQIKTLFRQQLLAIVPDLNLPF